MSDLIAEAKRVLTEFKGEAYTFGSGVLDQAVGRYAAELGQKALLAGPVSQDWFQPIQKRILSALKSAGIEVG